MRNFFCLNIYECYVRKSNTEPSGDDKQSFMRRYADRSHRYRREWTGWYAVSELARAAENRFADHCVR